MQAFLAAHETPLSKTALSAVQEGRWGDLIRLRVDPRSYSDADSYYRDAVVASLLKKFQGKIDNVDPVQTAKDKWWSAEKQNYLTNQRLIPYVPFRYQAFRPGLPNKDRAIDEFFTRVRKKIETWVGASPPSLVDGRFGPGATISDPGQLVTVPDKISSTPTLTPGALWFLPQWSATMWARDALMHGRQVVFCRGNRFATAPKKADEDRSIGIEPPINMFYQLGHGRVLRMRLRNATGWDLDKAQSTHRQVACEASVHLRFATLDLSNASDTVCRNLVRVLMPAPWVSILESLRSPITSMDGRSVYLEKFSSMGNGFTFELETIIFAALCSEAIIGSGHGAGVLGKDLFVFGDDIICPDGAVRAITAVLGFCGFTVNEDKSFHGQIPFRESCGGDFFSGRAVRPFYLKDEPRDITQKIALVNGISRAFRCESSMEMDDKQLRAWRRAVDWVPPGFRHFGPKRLGDVVIHEDQRSWTVKRSRTNGDNIRITVCQGMYLPWSHWREDVALASLVYGAGDGSRGVIPRKPKLRVISKWVPLYGTDWLPPNTVRHWEVHCSRPARPDYGCAKRARRE